MSEASGNVGKVPPAPSEEALRHFQARRSFETDPSEVYEDQKAGVEGLVVIDVRTKGAYDKSHIPGAISLPFDEINEETVANLPDGTVVTYCWGPGCNGSVQAAVALSELGRPVKEMIGGWEYWLREDFPVEGRGKVQRSYAGAGS
ncbi:MAG: rhodanese-like domain-containing protein [Actinomycetota bacterium]|nr:rhodanese-like domain-containing protein [Actinomycetota bacterium]